MATVELTKDNFEQVVTDNPMVIVDFWAPWCGPCRGFAPIFEKASEAHADVIFAKVNTEEEQEIAAAFAIRSIPTLMVFRDKAILYSQAGALPARAFGELISKAKEVDMAQVQKEISECEISGREISGREISGRENAQAGTGAMDKRHLNTGSNYD